MSDIVFLSSPSLSILVAHQQHRLEDGEAAKAAPQHRLLLIPSILYNELF